MVLCISCGGRWSVGSPLVASGHGAAEFHPLGLSVPVESKPVQGSSHWFPDTEVAWPVLDGAGAMSRVLGQHLVAG